MNKRKLLRENMQRYCSECLETMLERFALGRNYHYGFSKAVKLQVGECKYYIFVQIVFNLLTDEGLSCLRALFIALSIVYVPVG